MQSCVTRPSGKSLIAQNGASINCMYVAQALILKAHLRILIESSPSKLDTNSCGQFNKADEKPLRLLAPVSLNSLRPEGETLNMKEPVKDC
jgi:hypothetical protein